MGALSTWTSWVTLIGVGLALYVIVWPVWRLRATKAVVFRFYSTRWRKPQLPRPGPPWYRRLRGILSKFILAPLQERLTPPHYRHSVTELAELVDRRLGRNASAESDEPSLGSDTELIAIARFVSSKRRRLAHKDLRRSHKDVLCAGGCNTEYGEKRQTNFYTSGEGTGPNGWMCLGDEARGSTECYPKAVGKHFCGMCWWDHVVAPAGADSRSDESAE